MSAGLDQPPPVFRRWAHWYWLVLAVLVLDIALGALLTWWAAP